MSSNLPSSEILLKDDPKALHQSREFQIMFEYETLANYSPQGVFVLPDMKLLRIWHGVIFIRSGVFKGGVFRFTIEIPENYPLASPKVTFVCSIFHPLIDQDTGELSLQAKFPIWRPKKDFIFMLLRYVKGIFFQKDFTGCEKAIRNRAALQLLKIETEYQEQVSKCIMTCMEIRSGVTGYLKISLDANDHGHEMVMKNIKELEDEEHIKEFTDWFKSRYTCQE